MSSDSEGVAEAAPDTTNGFSTVELKEDQAYSSSDEDGEFEEKTGYAMLEFPDSQYIVTKLELIIGRDMQAQRAAEIFNRRINFPHVTDPEMKTVVYEEKDAAQPVADVGTNDDAPEADFTEYDELQNALVPKPSDVRSTANCVFLGLHQPKNAEQSFFLPGSNISRKHIKIYYNTDTEKWDMLVLSRNGAWIDGTWFPIGAIEELKHGDMIQIASIVFTFSLPQTEEQSETQSKLSFDFLNSLGEVVHHAKGGSEESEEEEVYYQYGGYDSDELGQLDTTDSDLEDEDEDEHEEEEEDQEAEVSRKVGKQRVTLKFANGRRKPKTGSPVNETVPEKTKKKIILAAPGKKGEASKRPLASKSLPGQKASKREDSETAKGKGKENDENRASPNPSNVDRNRSLVVGVDIHIPGVPTGFTLPARKKGPGRPPKDGVISKRERAQILKQIQHEKENGNTDPSKIKLVLPEASKSEKSSKKPSDIGEAGDNGTKDGDLFKKKQSKPVRSPSPEMRESDYTEDQLQRPQDNYVILIFQELKSHPEGKMNLQQIYAAIEKRYPYFKFKTSGSGWQSSVRHNLGQGKIFDKVERDGKGWMWAVKNEVTLESLREKKKKPTPPPMPPHHHHPTQTTYPAYGPVPPQFSQPQPNGHSQPFGMHPHHGGIPRAQIVPPSIAHSSAARPAGYSSPYDAKNQRPQIPTPHQPTPAYGQPPVRTSHSPFTQTPGVASLAQSARPVTTPTPPATQPPARPKHKPSDDVVETFMRVFTGSFSETSEITPEHANRIVKNAVRRVLEPEAMANVPEENNESAIVEAFRRCVEDSQPRQALNSGPFYGQRPLGLGLFSSSANAVRTGTPPVTTSGYQLYSTSAGASVSTSIMPTAGPPGINSTTPPSAAIPAAASAASSLKLTTQAPTSTSTSQAAAPAAATNGPSSASTTIATAAASALSAEAVRQAIANSLQGETKAPAVEPLTPPTAVTRKRAIEEIAEAEAREAEKRARPE